MAVITIHKAKTELSKLIARAEAGEEIIIARNDKPIVRLVPVGPAVAARKRKPGALSHLKDIPNSFFFDPLPEDELKLWEGGD
jgi:prevent-host-death family protein